MLRSVSLLILSCAAIQAAELPDGFDPGKWPGRAPAADQRAIGEQIRKAQQARNRKDMDELLAKYQLLLGKYAGVPETTPTYGAPIESAKPDLQKVERMAWSSFESLKGRNGWEEAARAEREKRVQPRLRVTFRNSMSNLRAAEANLAHSSEYKDYALRGFDYLASQQAFNGAFGYPYDANSSTGLTGAAATTVKRGESMGRRMTDGRWVIDDLDDGGLQFDNGEGGAGLLYAYQLTGNAKYLAGARRAGDWAATRPLVINWNYNSFSGYLLARLYRVTGEEKYLDAAIDKFEFGVLPAQLPNGRWVDQHNASPQYHALLCRNLIEYTLALEKAKHRLAAETKRKTLLALTSMAEETATYGASDYHEGLPLEALALGLVAFGPHPLWEKAADIYVNFLVNHYLPERIAAKEPRPEMLTAYLLYKKTNRNACEVNLSACHHLR